MRMELGDAIDTIVLWGGCACCTLRGDLIAALRELHGRRAAADIPPFRRAVLETTGSRSGSPAICARRRSGSAPQILGWSSHSDRGRVACGSAGLPSPGVPQAGRGGGTRPARQTDLVEASAAQALADVLQPLNPAARVIAACALLSPSELLDDSVSALPLLIAGMTDVAGLGSRAHRPEQTGGAAPAYV